MSLINEALKTAQRERSERPVSKGDLHVLEGFFPFIDAGARAASSRRGLVLGGAAGVVILLAAGGAFAIAHLRHPSAPSAPLRAITRPLAAPATLAAAVPTAAVQLAGAAVAPHQPPKDSATHPVLGAAGSGSGKKPAKPTASADHNTGDEARVVHIGEAAPVARSAAADTNTARMVPAARSSAAGGVTLGGPAQSPLDIRVSQGVDAMSRGDYAGANEFFKSAQSLGGTNRELFYDWALTLEHLGDLDAAGTAFNKALTLDPTWVDAMVAYANVLDLQGNRPGAIAEVNKALLVEPNNVGALLAYAHQLDLIKDFGDERGALKRAVAADNTNPKAHYYLGNVSLMLADTATAVAELNKTLHYAGNDPVFSPKTIEAIQGLLKKLPGGGSQ